MNAAAATANRWAGTAPDVAAFALGLGLAWWFDWNATDLVWSLWLSSLVVGSALILRLLVPDIVTGIAKDRARVVRPAIKAIVLVAGGIGASLGVAFFLGHFGAFHYVHSAFLHAFLPIEPEVRGFPGSSVYLEVVTRYWWFLPAAFVAEREAFRRLRGAGQAGSPVMVPYRNVVRMHLLIVFFGAAHIAGLQSFAVYAVVYAVYFFPWRVLRRNDALALGATHP